MIEGVLIILQVVLIVLKLAGILDITWKQALVPLWIFLGLILFYACALTGLLMSI